MNNVINDMTEFKSANFESLFTVQSNGHLEDLGTNYSNFDKIAPQIEKFTSKCPAPIKVPGME